MATPQLPLRNNSFLDMMHNPSYIPESAVWGETSNKPYTPSPLPTENKQTYLRGLVGSGLERLYKGNKLTGDLLAEGKLRARSLGVTEGEFDGFLKRKGIATPEQAAQRKAETSQRQAEASQRVISAKTGLDKLEAMQSDDYVLGSGGTTDMGAGSAKPVVFDPKKRAALQAGKDARDARRKGYSKASEHLFLQGKGLNRGLANISTDASKAAITDGMAAQAREAAKQQAMADDVENDKAQQQAASMLHSSLASNS